MIPADLAQEIRTLFPWLPEALVQTYVEAYVEHGDPDVAWATVRQAPEYDTYFAGNRRDDGTLRYSEQEYASIIEDYRDSVESVGISAELFNDRYAALIEGNVGPGEFYNRINAVTERVRFASADIRAAYTDRFGYDLTDEAILASVMDPNIGQAVLDRQITMAEISGEAATRGFDIDVDMATDLFGAGLDRQAATQLFGEAANLLPTLGVLARRHADPDDDFDLDEFTNAMVLDDPFQRRRMRRLIAQERASFSEAGNVGVARNQAGGLTGLQAR